MSEEVLTEVRLGFRSRRGSAARWRLRALGAGLLATAILSVETRSALVAQDPPGRPEARPPAPHPEIGRPGIGRPTIGIDGETRVRIDRALEYLYRNQNADGSWTDRVGRKVHNAYWGKTAPHVGVTGLAGIAFLASGTLPDQGARGRYCIAVRKALEYIIRQTEANGFIAANGSRMYSHAFATLFLAEALGTGLYPDDQRLQASLSRAVRLIVQAQNDEGGWRYLPNAVDSDMSVTVCQVFALRGARNAGLQVPKDTVDRAIRYVKDSFDPDYGAFKYQVEKSNVRSRHSFALTACGLATLYGAGEYNAPEIREGLKYLWSNRPRPHWAPNRFDFYYGHYYAVQAAYQAGGVYWTRWYEDVRGDLLALQRPDGSWIDLVGECYATAMAAIILQMPNQYLPITES